MPRTVQARVRARIKARLDELGMTGRELAKAAGHGDAWISGVIKGYQELTWTDFDKVAAKLGLAPSELVRLDDTDLRELTPQEMRMLRLYQAWPTEVRDRWLGMLEYFASTVPDAETARLLDRLRATPRSLRRPVLEWLLHLLEEGIPPEVATVGGGPATTGAPGVTGTTRRDRLARTRDALRERGADPRPEKKPPKEDGDAS